jgi:hypothetical protein
MECYSKSISYPESIMRTFHLAQINVGRALGPMDSAIMADFVAQLPAVNKIADETPGFVWRLQGETGDATEFKPFPEDDRMQMNASVWESIEALRAFVYRSSHVQPLRERARWFEKPTTPHMALWWIPAGHIPTVADFVERLEYLRAHGESPVAFSFARPFPMPEAPSIEPAEGEDLPAVVYEGRRFRTRSNSPTGTCTPETVFHYRQSASRVWATYGGGPVRFGSLVAVADRSGVLDMRYHHVDPAGEFRTGRCQSRPEVLDDGRLRLHESWQWTNGDQSSGHAITEEVIEA